MGSDVTVVVCCYTPERWSHLVAAVRSAQQQSHEPHEVIVVVDHNPDLLRMARTLSGVRVVPNSGPRGLSGARNSGVAAARGEVVAFLDDDAVAAFDWLRCLTRHYSDPGVAGVGGRVVPLWEADAPRWLPAEFWWVVGCSYVGQPTSKAAVRNPIGANMSFRRSVLKQVGGFDTSVGRVGKKPVGCEETELSIRIASTPGVSSILLDPEAVVRHHVPRERACWAYFRRRCWSEGLSKARVSTLSDPRQALSAERQYTTKTLPAGVRDAILAAVIGRDVSGITRAFNIGCGLAITASGYAAGRALTLTSGGPEP